MHLEFTESAGERDVLLRSQLLIAEEQHLVLDPRPGEFLEHVVGERLRQVEALDDAAECGTDLANLEVLPLECTQPDALGGEVGDRADHGLVGPESELAGIELADVARWLDPLQLGDRRGRGLQVVVGDAHLVPFSTTPIAARPNVHLGSALHIGDQLLLRRPRSGETVQLALRCRHVNFSEGSSP